MKKITLLLFTFHFLLFTYSQNLVPNPSFEEYSSCPDGQCQIYKCTGWFSSGFTPDYLNTCALDWGVGVPQNGWGFQYAASGNAYAGMFCFGPEFESNSREYLSIQLSNQLIIGDKYYVSFKISLADRLTNNCGIDKFGVLFTKVSNEINPCSYSSNLIPLNFANIYSDSIIIDTVNWVSISGSFIADSAYKYINLGNFFDDEHTNFIVLDTLNPCLSYYFIDDICVSTDSVTCYNITTTKFNNLINEIYYDSYNKQIIIENPYGFTINYKDCIITDLLGKKLSFTLENLENKIFIKMYDCKKGVYILRISTNKFNTSKKIFIY